MEDLNTELVGGSDKLRELLREVAMDHITSFASEIMDAEKLFKITTDCNFSADVGDGRTVRIIMDKPVSVA